ASVAVMGRTGNLTECPVCKAVHAEQDLAEKLRALIDSGDSETSTGLRQRAQTAKQKADTAQRALEALRSLAKWQQAAGLADDLACEEVFGELQHQHEKLRAALIDLQEAQEAEKTLGVTGI